MTEQNSVDLVSRIKGSIIGICVADALGGPAEGKRQSKFEPIQNFRPLARYKLPAGSWSSKGSLTLCLAESLHNTDFRINGVDVAQSFAKWATYGYHSSTDLCFDNKDANKQALRMWEVGLKQSQKPGKTFDFDTIQDKIYNSRQLNDVTDHGSLMRCAPIALAYFSYHGKSEVCKAARTQSEITHPAEVCADACVLYTIVLFAILAGHTKERLAALIFETDISNKFLRARLQQYRALDDWLVVSPEEIVATRNCNKSVVDTLHDALWVFFACKSWEDGALVAVNLGFDDGTVAAVFAGLAGAFFGYDAIPSKWSNSIQKVDLVHGIADNFAKAKCNVLSKEFSRFGHIFPHVGAKAAPTVISHLPPAREPTLQELYNDETDRANDPLLFYKQSIALHREPTLLNNETSGKMELFAQATRVIFDTPLGVRPSGRQEFLLQDATRFANGHTKTHLNLRTIIFAWNNREKTDAEYLLAEQKTRDELRKVQATGRHRSVSGSEELQSLRPEDRQYIKLYLSGTRDERDLPPFSPISLEDWAGSQTAAFVVEKQSREDCSGSESFSKTMRSPERTLQISTPAAQAVSVNTDRAATPQKATNLTSGSSLFTADDAPSSGTGGVFGFGQVAASVPRLRRQESTSFGKASESISSCSGSKNQAPLTSRNTTGNFAISDGWKPDKSVEHQLGSGDGVEATSFSAPTAQDLTGLSVEIDKLCDPLIKSRNQVLQEAGTDLQPARLAIPGAMMPGFDGIDTLKPPSPKFGQSDSTVIPGLGYLPETIESSSFSVQPLFAGPTRKLSSSSTSKDPNISRSDLLSLAGRTMSTPEHAEESMIDSPSMQDDPLKRKATTKTGEEPEAKKVRSGHLTRDFPSLLGEDVLLNDSNGGHLCGEHFSQPQTEDRKIWRLEDEAAETSVRGEEDWDVDMEESSEED